MGCNISNNHHCNDNEFDDSVNSNNNNDSNSSNNKIGGVRDLDKIRVDISTNVLIVGDNRVKVATSCVLASMAKDLARELSINICTKTPNIPQMNILKKDGINVYEGEMIDTNSITKVIKKCNPDVIFIVTPSSSTRVNETISLMQQCKRSGIGHVILLSNTIIESSISSIFGDHYIQIERFLITSGLSYTIIRIPIYMDNYLSQLDSIASYGIFYQPLTPYCVYSSIAIIDVAEAVTKVLLNPGIYADATITLNGPAACGNSAAEAFSLALGTIVTYEQISYESFKDCLLMSKMHEWQVNGMMELFKIYEKNEEIPEVTTLQELLGRPPTDVIALAKAAVADTGLNKVNRRGSYIFNANLRVTKYSPQFNQGPSGCMGILAVTMILVKTQKLKSSLKSSSKIRDSPKSKKKGVRFFTEETAAQSEVNKARFSFTDSDIAESPKLKNESEILLISETMESTEVDVPIDEKFVKFVKVDGNINISLDESFHRSDEIETSREFLGARERFNSIDSNDTGISLDSPKVIFGKEIDNFRHEEEEDISEQLVNKEYVTLHLKSKFVILLEGNLTFIPAYTYLSSMNTGVDSAQSIPVSTQMQSGKKQIFGSHPQSGKKIFGTQQMSLSKKLARKSVEEVLNSSSLDISSTSSSGRKISSEVSAPNSVNSAIFSSTSQIPKSSTKLDDKSLVARTIGSVENKSFSLQGYSVRVDPQNPLRIIVNGLKKWGKLFFLETASEDDHDRWIKCITSHIEFEENKLDCENTGYLI